MKRNIKRICFALTAVIMLSACGTGTTSEQTSQETSSSQETVSTSLAQIDNTKWQYDEADNVYWQVGISYCENPADEQYETLGVYVPGEYMTAEDNGDGTYTCEINQEGEVKGYTFETAPIVIPVDTPGYSAMAAPTGYAEGVSDYTDAGFVYVYAGCRGRDEGAPAGVTDLKAAIRYIRYNEGVIPGDTESIFSFGMSGGGAQSALLGSTGDSELYTPYLEEIGAVTGVSDAVAGSMCWCPITNLDYADEAYEWNMGNTREDLDDETQLLSNEMAEAFAQYINELGLKDENGNELTLTESEDGIYQAGSYYDYLKTVIENSLNNFLSDTTFPYTVEESRGGMGGGRGGMVGENKPEGNMEGDAVKENNENMPAEDDFYARDGVDRNTQTGGIVLSGTYETAQDYINALNAEKTWVNYDSETNTATITSIADFTEAVKRASKSIGAFDALDASQAENTLFGYGDGAGAHFDEVMAEILADNEIYGQEYAEDMEKTDSLGNTVSYRVNMYNPLYFLVDYYDGYQTSNVAKYWRIRTGISQSDTALTTEVNLALALENYGADVDFETVWGQQHTMAERTGDSTTNFIEWVNQCMEQE